MTQEWKEEFNSNYPQLFVKGDDWNWQPDIVNFIESLLSEARSNSYTSGYRDGYDQWFLEAKDIEKGIRNAVLSEVEREVEQAKRYDFGGYPDDRYMEEEFDGEYMNYKDISTILNNLRVK